MTRLDFAPAPENLRVRLDKWLWAARFFKTRALACEAITGGKVLLEGHHAKPGKEIGVNARLKIRRGDLTWEIIVQKVSVRRGPATEAATLYQETPESIAERATLVERYRLDTLARPVSSGKPNKADRRRLSELKHQY